MASILKVDDLRGNTSAGNITITSEGGSATMQLQQGLTKAWVNINGSSGTPTSRDSLNISSITDYSTGRYAPVLTSAMGNTNYSFCGITNANTGDTFNSPNNLVMGINNVITTTTSTFEMTNYASAYADSKYCFGHVFGDLA